MRIKSVSYTFGAFLNGKRENQTNKQVFYRGDTVDPGVYVERIKPGVRNAARTYEPPRKWKR